MYIQAFADNQ